MPKRTSFAISLLFASSPQLQGSETCNMVSYNQTCVACSPLTAVTTFGITISNPIVYLLISHTNKLKRRILGSILAHIQYVHMFHCYLPLAKVVHCHSQPSIIKNNLSIDTLRPRRNTSKTDQSSMIANEDGAPFICAADLSIGGAITQVVHTNTVGGRVHIAVCSSCDAAKEDFCRRSITTGNAETEVRAVIAAC